MKCNNCEHERKLHSWHEQTGFICHGTMNNINENDLNCHCMAKFEESLK